MDNSGADTFNQPMRPVRRPAEGYQMLEVEGPPGQPAEWWVDYNDHTKPMPAGWYQWLQNLFFTGPAGTESGDYSLQLDLLDQNGNSLASITVQCNYVAETEDYVFASGAVTPWPPPPAVATFNGIRATATGPGPNIVSNTIVYLLPHRLIVEARAQ